MARCISSKLLWFKTILRFLLWKQLISFEGAVGICLSPSLIREQIWNVWSCRCSVETRFRRSCWNLKKNQWHGANLCTPSTPQFSLFSQDKHFPISLHELTACIYYKLAIERGVRGCYPDEEFYQHLTPQSLQTVVDQLPAATTAANTNLSSSLPRKNDWKPEHDEEDLNIVCEDLSDQDLDVIIKYDCSPSCSADASLGILPLLSWLPMKRILLNANGSHCLKDILQYVSKKFLIQSNLPLDFMLLHQQQECGLLETMGNFSMFPLILTQLPLQNFLGYRTEPLCLGRRAPIPEIQNLIMKRS